MTKPHPEGPEPARAASSWQEIPEGERQCCRQMRLIGVSCQSAGADQDRGGEQPAPGVAIIGDSRSRRCKPHCAAVASALNPPQAAR